MTLNDSDGRLCDFFLFAKPSDGLFESDKWQTVINELEITIDNIVGVSAWPLVGWWEIRFLFRRLLIARSVRRYHFQVRMKSVKLTLLAVEGGCGCWDHLFSEVTFLL